MGKSKDPALLWYPGDYIAGTMEYSFEEKGAYMEILMMQFKNGGPLSEDKIKRILREKYGSIWSVICEKFRMDDKGQWFNERLEVERNKRQNFTESRRNNLKKPHKESHMVTHMQPHTEPRMENGNAIENENEKKVIKEVPENSDVTTAADILTPETFKAFSVPRETIDERLQSALDELYIDSEKTKWSHVDFSFELETFRNKVRGSPDHYRNHDTSGIRLAFQSQLRNAKHKKNGSSKTRKQQNTSDLVAGFAARHGSDADK